jgi:hypothetical protein
MNEEMQRLFAMAHKSFRDALDELSHAMALCLAKAREIHRHSQPDDQRCKTLIWLGNRAGEVWQGAVPMDFFWTPGAAADWKPVLIQSRRGIDNADKTLRECLRHTRTFDQEDTAIQEAITHLRNAKEHFARTVKAIRAMTDAANGDDE